MCRGTRGKRGLNNLDLNFSFPIAFSFGGATSLPWNNKRLCAEVPHTLSCLPTKSATKHKASITFLDTVQVDLIDLLHSPGNEYNYIGHFMDHFSVFFFFH